MGLTNTAGGLGGGLGGAVSPPMGVLREEDTYKNFQNFHLHWLQNCFVGLENKSTYQNLKIDLELYLGAFRSNNDTF